jgi:hypothetical protein
MYPNRRRTRVRVSDDSVIQDATVATLDLRSSIHHAAAPPLCVSHVVMGGYHQILYVMIEYIWIFQTV